MENVDLMASRQEMEIAWASGGWMGKMGVKHARSVAGPVLLRVCSGCAQGILQKRSLIMTMILAAQVFAAFGILESVACSRKSDAFSSAFSDLVTSLSIKFITQILRRVSVKRRRGYGIVFKCLVMLGLIYTY